MAKAKTAQKVITPELEYALTTLCQFVEKLRPRHIDAALEEMDLSDEGFEEEMQVIRDVVGYVEDETPDDDDDDDDDDDVLDRISHPIGE